MKYWTGYLTAAVIGAVSWALMELAKRFTTLVDMVFPYVSRTVQTFLAQWTQPLDFCLWQALVLAAGVLVVASIVVMIVLHINPVQWFGWVLAGGSVIFLLHTLVFGLNYYTGPLAEDIRLEQREYDVEDLASAAEYYRDIANLLAVQVPRDAAGNVVFDDFDTLAAQAADGFDTLVYEESYPVFAGSTLPVKKLGWANLYSSMGITGVTMGLTGEAAVNPQIPAVCLPFTMCHEMAHRMSIANERDANFTAFLSCQANESIQFRYSAYFMAYKYCYSALIQLNTNASVGAAARVATMVGPEMQQDLNTYQIFFNEKRSEVATRTADTVNDTYLKASGTPEGINSYSQVSDLLVNWHYQTVILPTITEQESPFDPYDENQVDLSGNVNAKEPKPTEPPVSGGVG